MTPLQFSTALSLTETNNNPAAVGDAGQAISRWQVHPCWIYDHGILPLQHETWDAWIERCVEKFFTAHIYLPPVEIAMWFHLGHRTLAADKDWDGPYAVRFINSVAKV